MRSRDEQGGELAADRNEASYSLFNAVSKPRGPILCLSKELFAPVARPNSKM